VDGSNNPFQLVSRRAMNAQLFHIRGMDHLVAINDTNFNSMQLTQKTTGPVSSH